MSSGWLTWRWRLIRMSYGKFIMSSGWHTLPFMSSGWLTWRWYLIRMSYGKFIMSSGWHTLPFMSSGWLNWGGFLIRMSYGNVIMSSGWDTLPFLSHPDEIANFDFPQHAVALQRFRPSPLKWPFLLHIPVNAIDTPEGGRCMCTGWAFYPKVSEWVTGHVISYPYPYPAGPLSRHVMMN